MKVVHSDSYLLHNPMAEVEGSGQTFRISVQGYTGRITVERVQAHGDQGGGDGGDGG